MTKYGQSHSLFIDNWIQMSHVLFRFALQTLIFLKASYPI